MKGLFGGIGYLLLVALGLFQIFATADGIERFTGWWPFVCWLLAFVFGWMPVIGTAAGIYGANTAWGWTSLWSFALFLGTPAVLWAGAMLAGGTAAIANRFRGS